MTASVKASMNNPLFRDLQASMFDVAVGYTRVYGCSVVVVCNPHCNPNQNRWKSLSTWSTLRNSTRERSSCGFEIRVSGMHKEVHCLLDDLNSGTTSRNRRVRNPSRPTVFASLLPPPFCMQLPIYGLSRCPLNLCQHDGRSRTGASAKAQFYRM